MDDVNVLLVEDNLGDVRLIERAFEDRALPGAVHAVQTGGEALDWLFRRGDHEGAPRPDLVFLDLNLPATSGLAVLEAIRDDRHLRRLPVIVLTSSRSREDLLEAYEEHANAYLVKPVDPEEFADLVQTCVEFWVSTATLPPVADDDDEGNQR